MMMETLSDRILRENQAIFDEMVAHRFVLDIEKDRLPTEVFERYLVFEGAFVETAIAIFAHATAKAPGIGDQRWLICVLDALANQQIAYFEKTFTARGINPCMFDLTHPDVDAFREGMLTIARNGTFIDTVVAMFAAEWMYWTWSKTAKQKTISDPLLAEWVGLHTDETFAAQATWLKTRIDEAQSRLSEDDCQRLVAIFAHVMQLEIDFHNAAYNGAAYDREKTP